jgi:hypothetical protein
VDETAEEVAAVRASQRRRGLTSSRSDGRRVRRPQAARPAFSLTRQTDVNAARSSGEPPRLVGGLIREYELAAA